MLLNEGEEEMRDLVDGDANRASSASTSVLLPWQVSFPLVSDPGKMAKDVLSDGFSVSLRAGKSWKCAVQLDRCLAVLPSEAVTGTEPGNLGILVLGWEG